jgi:Pectate lyase superfamily protein
MATIDIRGATLSAADPPIGTNPNPDLAIKAPVRAATTGSNITLAGLFTLDGVALAACDRVLAKDQADATTNGLYNAATGPWTRTVDAANNAQFATGLDVVVTSGTVNGGGTFQLTAANPVVLGASPLTWARVNVNINPFVGDSGAGGIAGLVPAPPAGSAAASKFLMASGSFTALAAGMTGFTQAGAGAFARTVDAKLKDAFLCITDFGGAGDNATDNTAPLNHALAALTGTGGCIYFPPGKYRFNTAISFNMPAGVFSVSMIGAGQDATVLTWPNAAGGMTFNYAGVASSVHLRDLSITTGVANGGTGVTFNQTVSTLLNPANTAQSDLFRVTFRGDDAYEGTDYWTTCLNIVGVSNIAMDTVDFVGPASIAGTGASFAGASANNIAVVLWGFKCTFNALNVGISYGTQAQGVNLVQSQWDACNYAVYVQAGGANLDQLTVTACQVNCKTCGINVQSVLPNITIAQCLFVMVPNNYTAVQLSFSDYFCIVGNNFNGSGGSSMTGVSIALGNGAGVVADNTFFNLASGIWIQTNAGNNCIHHNEFMSVTTPITNSSAAINNVITDNPGYNPVGGSTPGVGTSPFTYRAGPSPETLYIIGGSGISNIATSGVTIATADSATLPVTVHLGPNETVTITYSTTAPFMNRVVH